MNSFDVARDVPLPITIPLSIPLAIAIRQTKMKTKNIKKKYKKIQTMFKSNNSKTNELNRKYQNQTKNKKLHEKKYQINNKKFQNNQNKKIECTNENEAIVINHLNTNNIAPVLYAKPISLVQNSIPYVLSISSTSTSSKKLRSKKKYYSACESCHASKTKCNVHIDGIIPCNRCKKINQTCIQRIRPCFEDKKNNNLEICKTQKQMNNQINKNENHHFNTNTIFEYNINDQEYIDCNNSSQNINIILQNEYENKYLYHESCLNLSNTNYINENLDIQSKVQVQNILDEHAAKIDENLILNTNTNSNINLDTNLNININIDINKMILSKSIPMSITTSKATSGIDSYNDRVVNALLLLSSENMKIWYVRHMYEQSEVRQIPK
jgi:hypothetical protein